jgi:hypothetical protein
MILSISKSQIFLKTPSGYTTHLNKTGSPNITSVNSLFTNLGVGMINRKNHAINSAIAFIKYLDGQSTCQMSAKPLQYINHRKGKR